MLCARAFIRVGAELKGMVVAGCVAPENWPPPPDFVPIGQPSMPIPNMVGGLPGMTNMATSIMKKEIANPMLTFVPNFPPCLQKTAMPEPTDAFDTKQLFEWLPKTGVIGKMMTFYYTFVFSTPYKPFIPSAGVESDLFFPHGMADPRNKALVKFRQDVSGFIQAYYPPSEPVQMSQWPLNIET